MSTSTSNFDLKVDAENTFKTVPAWKHELNERLAATRARRTRGTMERMEQSQLPNLEHFADKAESRASLLAAKVAERYAKAPSYSEILAANARTAALAAEAAASAARQVCVSAQALLAGIDPGNPGDPDESAVSHDAPPCHPDPAPGSAANPVASSASFDLAPPPSAEPLPVNLIEFPRELVAARRTRPRLEEGPLRESSDQASQSQPQLRIFEVEPESISRTVKIEGAAPEWSSIRLDAKPFSMLPDEECSSSPDLPLKAAPLEDRCMAWICDAALVLFAFVVFVFVFAACTAHPPTGKPALLAGGLVLAGLFLLYQYLFFRFTEGTPGMRYAKIALCTFEDENPTRKAMRRRILFLVLSAAPLGLGFAWAWFDAERLGWHDRLTRMYQRSY